jgi:hypothetical protein
VYDSLMMFLLFVVASSLACIAVALWGIMFTIKQAVALLEGLVKVIVNTINRWKV